MQCHICGLLCEKQVSRAGTSNYIPQILWEVITCPCPWYLLLAQFLISFLAYLPMRSEPNIEFGYYLRQKNEVQLWSIPSEICIYMRLGVIVRTCKKTIKGVHRMGWDHWWPWKKQSEESWAKCSKMPTSRPAEIHDDFVTWESFPFYWPFVRGIHGRIIDSSLKVPVMQIFYFCC